MNGKKLYRLCKENNFLLTKNKKRIKANRKVCTNKVIIAPNQLWEFDISAGHLRDYTFDLYSEPGRSLPLENAAKIKIDGVIVEVDSPSYTAIYEIKDTEVLLISYQARR